MSKLVQFLALCLFVTTAQANWFWDILWNADIVPIIECIEELEDGSGNIRSHFGWNNKHGGFLDASLFLLNEIHDCDCTAPKQYNLPNCIWGNPGRTQFWPKNPLSCTCKPTCYFRFGVFQAWCSQAPKCGNSSPPPTVTCPATASAFTTANKATGSVSFNVTSSSSHNTITNNFDSETAQGTLAFSDNFPIGITKVVFVATDSSGQHGNCTTTITIKDNQNPSLVCSANAVINTDPNEATATLASGVAYATGSDNSGSVSVGNSQGTGTLTASTGVDDAAGAVLSLGNTVITFTAVDPSGNKVSCNVTVTVRDKQPPTLSCPTPAAPFPTYPMDPSLPTATVTLGGTVSDNAPGAVAVSPDDQGFPQLKSGVEVFQYTFAYPGGQQSVQFTATDVAGNQATCSYAFSVVDTQNPTFTKCPADFAQNTLATTNYADVTLASLTATATDNVAVASLGSVPTLVVDNFFALSSTTGKSAVTTVQWTATDTSGLTATCTIHVTVNDNTNPIISCPAAVTVNATQGGDSIAVDLVPTFSDNSDSGTTTFTTLSPAAGSFTFTIGAHTTTFTATDPSGNHASCDAQVTVLDMQPPVFVSCPAPFTEPMSAGSALFNDYTTSPLALAASDNSCPLVSPGNADCAAISWSFGSQSGSGAFNLALPGGLNVITFSATDAYGNVATCQVNVTVVDTQPPTVNAPGFPASLSIVTDVGSIYATVPLNLALIVDNVAVASTTITAGSATFTGNPVSLLPAASPYDVHIKACDGATPPNCLAIDISVTVTQRDYCSPNPCCATCACDQTKTGFTCVAPPSCTLSLQDGSVLGSPTLSNSCDLLIGSLNCGTSIINTYAWSVNGVATADTSSALSPFTLSPFATTVTVVATVTNDAAPSGVSFTQTLSLTPCCAYTLSLSPASSNVPAWGLALNPAASLITPPVSTFSCPQAYTYSSTSVDQSLFSGSGPFVVAVTASVTYNGNTQVVASASTGGLSECSYSLNVGATLTITGSSFDLCPSGCASCVHTPAAGCAPSSGFVCSVSYNGGAFQAGSVVQVSGFPNGATSGSVVLQAVPDNAGTNYALAAADSTVSVTIQPTITCHYTVTASFTGTDTSADSLGFSVSVSVNDNSCAISNFNLVLNGDTAHAITNTVSGSSSSFTVSNSQVFVNSGSATFYGCVNSQGACSTVIPLSFNCQYTVSIDAGSRLVPAYLPVSATVSAVYPPSQSAATFCSIPSYSLSLVSGSSYTRSNNLLDYAVFGGAFPLSASTSATVSAVAHLSGGTSITSAGVAFTPCTYTVNFGNTASTSLDCLDGSFGATLLLASVTPVQSGCPAYVDGPQSFTSGSTTISYSVGESWRTSLPTGFTNTGTGDGISCKIYCQSTCAIGNLVLTDPVPVTTTFSFSLASGQTVSFAQGVSPGFQALPDDMAVIFANSVGAGAPPVGLIRPDGTQPVNIFAQIIVPADHEPNRWPDTWVFNYQWSCTIETFAPADGTTILSSYELFPSVSLAHDAGLTTPIPLCEWYLQDLNVQHLTGSRTACDIQQCAGGPAGGNNPIITLTLPANTPTQRGWPWASDGGGHSSGYYAFNNEYNFQLFISAGNPGQSDPRTLSVSWGVQSALAAYNCGGFCDPSGHGQCYSFCCDPAYNRKGGTCQQTISANGVTTCHVGGTISFMGTTFADNPACNAPTNSLSSAPSHFSTQASSSTTQSSPLVNANTFIWHDMSGNNVDLSAFSGPILNASPNQLPIGVEVHPCVQVRDPTSHERLGGYCFAPFTLTNDAPTSSSASPLTVHPSTGTAWTSLFVLQAQGFTANSTVKYSFAYIPQGSSTEIVLTPLQASPTLTAYLPAGQLTLVVYAVSKGESTRATTTVNVAQSLSTDSPACQALSLVSGLYSRAVSSALPDVAVHVMTFVGPALANAPSPLVCGGLDQSKTVAALFDQFTSLLSQYVSANGGDPFRAKMVSQALLSISNLLQGPMTSAQQSTVLFVLDNVIGGMQPAAAPTAATSSAVTELLSMMLRADCSNLDEIAQRALSLSAFTAGLDVAGDSIDLVAPSLEVFNARLLTGLDASVQSPGANPMSATLPAAAVVRNFDLMVDLLLARYSCVKTGGLIGQPVSDIVDFDLLSLAHSYVMPVTGLTTPATLTIPLHSSAAQCAPASLQCAFWDSSASAWSTAQVSTVSVSTLPNGAQAVKCSTTHLARFAVVSSDPTCIAVSSSAATAPTSSKSVTSGFLVALAVYALLAVGAFASLLYLRKAPEASLKAPVAAALFVAFVARLLWALSASNAASFAGVADILSVLPFVAFFFVNTSIFARVRAEAALPQHHLGLAFNAFYVLMAAGVVALIVGATKSSSAQQDIAAVALRVLGGVSLMASLLFTIFAFFSKSMEQKPDQVLARYSVVFGASCVAESFAWLVAASAGPLFAVFIPIDLIICFSAAQLYSARAVISRKQQPLASTSSGLPATSAVVPASTA